MTIGRCGALVPLVALGFLFSEGTGSRAEDVPQTDLPQVHQVREVEGWSVHVDSRLLQPPHEELGKNALRLLTDRLYEVQLVVPEDKVKRLRQVPIWLDLNHGDLTAMQYHPSAGWLKAHGYSEALAKVVHVPFAERFASPRHHQQQPWAILHELAHAYHDQELSFDNPRIREVWQRVKDTGRFDKVLHIDGREQKHYALTNPMEFFAEMSEAYFGLNDFYPFHRAELQRDWPEIHRLLQETWGPLRK